MMARLATHYGNQMTYPLLREQMEQAPTAMVTEHLSGMVYCPLRSSHIAVMRCGEYQATFGCHLKSRISNGKCPNAASAREISEVRREWERGKLEEKPGTEDRPGVRLAKTMRYYSICQACGKEKPETSSSRCWSCGNSTKGRWRK